MKRGEVRATIWTFPKKSGKHPGLETPRFSFPQESFTSSPGNQSMLKRRDDRKLHIFAEDLRRKPAGKLGVRAPQIVPLRPKFPRSNEWCFPSSVFRVVCSEGDLDPQRQKAPKCLKRLVFSAILRPSEGIYPHRKLR